MSSHIAKEEDEELITSIDRERHERQYKTRVKEATH